MLAAGCEDGSLRLYDVTQDGEPEHIRTFDKQEGKNTVSLLESQPNSRFPLEYKEKNIFFFRNSSECISYAYLGRILSIAWQQSDSDSILVTGSSDSLIRVYNVSTGK